VLKEGFMSFKWNSRFAMAGLGCLLVLSMAAPAASQETAKVTPTPQAANAQAPPSPAVSREPGKVVASYSMGTITQEELDRMIGPNLARLHEQMYDLEKRTIRQMVAERLLRAEAIKEGMPRDLYYAKHVTSKIQDPPEAQVEQVMKQYRSQLPKKDEDARKLVVQALRDREKQQLEKALEAKLLQGADLKIFLEEPRFPVTVSKDDPVRGPAGAPVTLVEFSDFQCPYCARSQATLHRILETYPTQVRIVFKNMPGQRHDRARPAAEAALCAGRQGKFWEMHDWLFSHHTGLSDEAISTEAKALGLDMDVFSTCRSKHETSAQIDASLKEARALGLTGTPIFFVNGKMIRGARPFEVFDDAIRSELQHLGIPAPEVAQAAPAAPKPPAAQEAGKPTGGEAQPEKK